MPAPDADALLLALETSGGRGSVALLRGQVAVLEGRLPEQGATAETLLPALDALLADAGQRLADVQAFAVSIGPGSFTGLRIGVATVKGLAFGSDAPVAPVPTLAALALAAPAGEGPAVALLDARRGEVYAAGYAVPGDVRADALPEGLYAVEELLQGLPRTCRLVGEGVAICGARLRDGLGAGVVLADDPPWPRAKDVGRLGARLLARGAGCTADALVPRYVRRAEAEARRTGEATEPE